ncbi:hypothetical protein HAZT_HAZT012060, partial [Hyalella azteca]
MDCNICVICRGSLSDGQPTVTLRQKGSTSMNEANVHRSDNLKHSLDRPSTKDMTHSRRSRDAAGVKVNFNHSTHFTTKKEQFLTNASNKQEFVNMLSQKLVSTGCHVLQTEGEEALVYLYGGQPNEGLYKLRYHKFCEKVSISASPVQVHTLPPTAAPA